VREPTVAAVMTTRVVAVTPDTTFKELVTVMTREGVSGLPVVEEGKPVGVVTEADTLAKQEYRGGTRPWLFAGRARRTRWRKATGLTATDLMTTPAVTVEETAPVSAAARLLAEKRIRRLCVVNEAGELAGVVSRRDVIGTFLRPDDDIRTDIVEHVFRHGMWLFPGTLEVTVADGVATLTGTVERRTTAQVAGQLTHSVTGVIGVKNKVMYDMDDTVTPAQ